jgi:hypothetical protein
MNEEKQAARILTELIGYFWRNQIYQLNVDFKPEKNSYEIVVSGVSPNRPDDLDDFIGSLHETSQPEVAEYYDLLLGLDGGDSDAYHLLGAVIDQADIIYEQQVLSVKVIKRS